MSHTPLFLFAEINPLDNEEVRNIIGCEIVGEHVHFQIVDQFGNKGMKKVKKTQFILNQIKQFQISIEANI